MIKIRQLRFGYPNSLDMRIDALDVEDGEQVVLLGPSGCGKSTFLAIIAGILTPVSGAVEVNGVALDSCSEQARRRFRSRHIGFIFQSFELLEYLTVFDNILLPYRLLDYQLDASVQQRTVDLLASVGLESKQLRFPGELSFGERQRVAICRALVTEPALLLADEPTGNLDPESSQAIAILLREHPAARNTTLIMATHDRDLLPQFSRAIKLNELGQKP